MVRTDEILPGISVDRARKAMHKFCIGGTYCSCYIVISVGNFGLAGCENLDRPYLILIIDRCRTSVDSR
jgi:hypothetical protein